MVKTLNVDDIMFSPKNPRRPITTEDEEYQQIKTSIDRFGVVEPLVVNSVNNHCISGNHRLTVLKDIGAKQVLCIVIDEPDENREIALTIALNKIKGRWDYDKLSEVFESLGNEDFEVTGFDSNELERILNNNAFMQESEDDETTIPVDISVNIKIGGYSFMMLKEDYIDMINTIRIEKGFDDNEIIAELKRRLKQ